MACQNSEEEFGFAWIFLDLLGSVRIYLDPLGSYCVRQRAAEFVTSLAVTDETGGIPSSASRYSIPYGFQAKHCAT